MPPPFLKVTPFILALFCAFSVRAEEEMKVARAEPVSERDVTTPGADLS